MGQGFHLSAFPESPALPCDEPGTQVQPEGTLPLLHFLHRVWGDDAKVTLKGEFVGRS